MLNLAVFERETLRVAPDAVVARLRTEARAPARPRPRPHRADSSGNVASEDLELSSEGLEGQTADTCVREAASLDLRAGRDAAGALLVTKAEAQTLLALNKTQKGFCQLEGSRLTLAMHCGLVLLPGSGAARAREECVAEHDGAGPYADADSQPRGAEPATLEILPKIWGAIEREGTDATSLVDATDGDVRLALTRARRALLRLLQAGGELLVSPMDAAPQDADHAPLLDLFIRSFLRETLRVTKGGLLTRYVEVTDDQPVIRGRLHLAASERLSQTRPGLWRCTRDDLSIDNPYNQALLAAIEHVRPHVRRRATERLWFEARSCFGEVSPIRLNASFIDRLKRGRESARYDQALRSARRILALLSPTLAGGADPAPALLFNMQSLFEHWVARHEQSRAPEGLVVARKGASRDLAVIGLGGASAGHPAGEASLRAFRQMPDVLIWATGANRSSDSPAAIVDAKWKWIDPQRADWGVSEHDARQALAYLLRYGCDHARLAYPILSGARLPEAGPPTFWIDARGSAVSIEVSLVPIDV